MKYLKKFNENRISIFDDSWTDFLPSKLKIVTSNGDFELNLPKEKSNLGHNVNISHLFNNLQITYSTDPVVTVVIDNIVIKLKDINLQIQNMLIN